MEPGYIIAKLHKLGKATWFESGLDSGCVAFLISRLTVDQVINVIESRGHVGIENFKIRTNVAIL